VSSPRHRGPRRYGRRRLLALVVVALATGTPVLAWGYWSVVAGAGGKGAAVAASVNQGAAPTATRSGAANVIVSWGASTLSDGRPVDGYLITRYSAVNGSAQVILPACSGTITATSCTEAVVPAGQWQYTVTPVIGAN
jgi:hypothetical protein